MSSNPTAPASNFIRSLIESDLASGKHKTIVTRFPPEPNGYLHVGHAKSFAVAWPFLAKNPLMGWGLGSLLRLLALVLYALVGVRSSGLAAAPALLSLAGFFFVSMLLESLFLKP